MYPGFGTPGLDQRYDTLLTDTEIKVLVKMVCKESFSQ